jgi:pimeloyl-ACP methyl ester carboxylesterase
MYQNIADIKTYIRMFGNGERKIILLHGWTHKGGLNWIKVAESLASKGFTVCLPDLPGFGKSHEPQAIWGAVDYANWVKQLIYFLDWDTYKLGGHSFGGAIAMIVATRNDGVEKLFLMSPAIVRRPSKKRGSFISRQAKKVLTGMFSSIRPYIAKTWRRLVGSPDYARTSKKMAAIMRRVIQEDLVNYLEFIAAPTVLVWGTEDTYTPYTDSEIVAKHIAHVEFKTLHNINHGIHLHATDEVISILNN